MNDIVTKLKNADWEVAARTYGNNHATLIGIIAAWWNKLDPRHRVFEGGPSHGRKSREGRRGQCDAILSDRSGKPRIALEVEGTRYDGTIEKLRYFLEEHKDRNPDLDGVDAAILVLYGYSLKGRKDERACLPIDRDAIARTIKQELSRTIQPNKLALVIVEKALCAHIKKESLRARNDYYKQNIVGIHAHQFGRDWTLGKTAWSAHFSRL